MHPVFKMIILCRKATTERKDILILVMKKANTHLLHTVHGPTYVNIFHMLSKQKSEHEFTMLRRRIIVPTMRDEKIWTKTLSAKKEVEKMSMVKKKVILMVLIKLMIVILVMILTALLYLVIVDYLFAKLAYVCFNH